MGSGVSGQEAEEEGGEYTGVGSLDYGQNSPEWWNPDIVGPWSWT